MDAAAAMEIRFADEAQNAERYRVMRILLEQ
ncbi:MAG: hypothetical protein QOI06_1821 [Nocardioidaceae bacterium]|jgi:hypothetical protein|nr:hypothetical protein [Nocardioidaceae bacterium]